MPAVNGGLTEETHSVFMEELVDNGPFDSESEALEFCVIYTLQHKYGIESSRR